MSELTIEFGGEELTLMPSGGCFWAAKGTLFVADLHLGKSQSFRARGLAVPTGSSAATLKKLYVDLNSTGAKTVVILGDLFHHRDSHCEALLAQVLEWRSRCSNPNCLLVEGNHDLWAGVPNEYGFTLIQQDHFEPWAVFHEPDFLDDRLALAGHIHPGVKIALDSRTAIKAKAFWRTSNRLVLPSYGQFTGSSTIEPKPDHGIYPIIEDRVIRISHALLAKEIPPFGRSRRFAASEL
ncbi:MAG: ligase-associated DNA damage response endonuclease PdeM [Armatimonadetes bacterium]|nr:ligase-associated DNA damage response endonuclease PdeM [Armatimonadota bacterium]